jgi:hypothetical protein
MQICLKVPFVLWSEKSAAKDVPFFWNNATTWSNCMCKTIAAYHFVKKKLYFS